MTSNEKEKNAACLKQAAEQNKNMKVLRVATCLLAKYTLNIH